MHLASDQQLMQRTSPAYATAPDQQLLHLDSPQSMQPASQELLHLTSQQLSQFASASKQLTQCYVDTLSCSLQCSLQGGDFNTCYCSASGGAVYTTAILLENAPPKPAVLAAAFKCATLPPAFKSTPVSHVAAFKSASTTASKFAYTAASKFAGCAHSDNQCYQVNLSIPNIDSYASNISASMTQGGECGNYTHLPATYGPYSNHDNSIVATLINHNARGIDAQVDQPAKPGRAIYRHEANAGRTVLSLLLLVTHQAFESAVFTATLKPAIPAAASRHPFAAHKPAPVAHKLAIQQMTTVSTTQAIDYKIYVGCNYTSTGFSTICHIAYWFYTQSGTTTEPFDLAALAMPITTFQSASYARYAAV